MYLKEIGFLRTNAVGMEWNGIPLNSQNCFAISLYSFLYLYIALTQFKFKAMHR